MRLGGARKNERNGHGYIIGDRNNARASLFSSPGDLSTAVAFSLSVKTTYARKYYVPREIYIYIRNCDIYKQS